jgi:hypothetical protein
MMPQGRGIRYYKSTNFPLVWEEVTGTENSNMTWDDNSIVFYNNRWWMFSMLNQEGQKAAFLHIMYADTPLGPWTQHPNNCWKKGVVNGSAVIECYGKDGVPHKPLTSHRRHQGIRSGGRPIVFNEKLYRIVQHSIRTYGDEMDLYHVVNLTTTGPFVEEVVPEFRTNLRRKIHIEPWNSGRYHHVDMHRVKSAGGGHHWVAVMDGDSGTGHTCIANNTGIWDGPRCADLLTL